MRTRVGLAWTAAMLIAASAHAQAPVSDDDRAAARALFVEGSRLQNENKPAEALDRFERAQRVFSAPTTQLHIGQCQDALGRLVEAAESYRALVRTPLPAGSPAAFIQAQQQGAQELAKIEPRIPQVKIDVQPPNVPNLQVMVDGVAMNAALVGVQRPMNPGTHKITVFAPGYGRQDQTIEIKERQIKQTTITLQAGAVVYTAPPILPGTPTAPPPYNPNPPTAPVPPPAAPGAPAAPDKPAEGEWVPVKKSPSAGLLLGARLGVMFPSGGLAQFNSVQRDLSEFAGVGFAFGPEVAFRFGRLFGIGAVFEHGSMAKGSKPAFSSELTRDYVVTTSTNMLGVKAVFISNPESVGFYGEVGVDYRWLSVTLEEETASGKRTDTVSGAELDIGGGVYIRAGSFVFIPKLSFAVGSFNKINRSCENGFAQCALLPSSDIPQTATHTFILLGVNGYYNLDFGGK